MNHELSRFLDWVATKIKHVPLQARQEIIDQIREYLIDAQYAQNVSFDTIIFGIGDKIQFINGFLLRAGERPLKQPAAGFKKLMLVMGVLGIVFLVGSFAFYQYIKTQFDFDMADGKIKVFGQDVDIDTQMTTVPSRFNSGGLQSAGKKIVKKQISLPTTTNLMAITLGNTKSTINFTKGDSFNLDCEVGASEQVVINTNSSAVVNIGGRSNCDIQIPDRLELVVNYSDGRLALDRPKQSFTINSEKGDLSWIKELSSEYQVFYNVKTANVSGSVQNILNNTSNNKAQINLNDGRVHFIDPS